MGLIEGVVGAALLFVALGSEGLAIKYGILAPDFDEALFRQAPSKAEFWGTFTEPCVPYLRYIYYEIARASLVHAGAFLLLGGLRGGWAPLRSAWNRSTLSRGVMNVCFLAACGYRGAMMWKGWYEDAGWASVSAALGDVHLALQEKKAGLHFVPQSAFDRLYVYDSSFQRLSAVMFGFQAKNLVDTVVFRDGAVFVVHHIVTMTVALFALHPYSHLYGSFFFGVSEISTTVLAVLALFDGEFGVPELERDFPNLRLFIGTVFAISFVLIRCVIWPYLTFFYCKDALEILQHPADVHSPLLVKVFMGGLIILSVMQVIWLGEICAKVYEEVLGPALEAVGLVKAKKKKAT